MNAKKLFDLSNNVIILTGAGGLLGTKYAEGLSQVNANVVLADKNYSKVKQMEKTLRAKFNVDPLAIKVDLTDKKSVKTMMKLVLKKYGCVDGLINNAMYPEGEKGLRNYLMQNLQYPDLAVEKKLEDKVTIVYRISKKGKVKHIRVKNGEYKVLVKASKRVLKNMTDWKPGEVHGKRITTQYQQDFNFVLL